MKALIWVGCIFFYSAVVGLLAVNGVMLGAIPTFLLLYFTIILPARWLCGQWDERKAARDLPYTENGNGEKRTVYMEKEETAAMDMPEKKETESGGLGVAFYQTQQSREARREPEAGPSPGEGEWVRGGTETPRVTPPMKPAGQTQKPNGMVRYCKRCGGVVNGETKRCEKCGKQYCRMSKSAVAAWAVAAVCAAVLGGVSWFFTAKLQTMQHELSAAQTELDKSKKENGALRRELTDAREDLKQKEKATEDEEFAMFLLTVAAGITTEEDDTYYHAPDCDRIKDSGSLWIWSTFFLEDTGYVPCPDCHTAAEIEMIEDEFS